MSRCWRFLVPPTSSRTNRSRWFHRRVHFLGLPVLRDVAEGGTNAEVFPRGFVVDDEPVTEVLLEPVVEFLIDKAGKGGSGSGKADLVGMIKTGRQEEVAATLSKHLQ